ncbi:shikimate dehydrogenase [Ensifer soli]|uniref:shikimate dehydrogenase n=1 Tax=Ciceribacter sp. sgz301302 TaxID=3342379 RepID=UPI0035B7E918
MHDSRETIINHAFVAGYPIRHSRSPLIHGHWLKTFGLPGSYRAIEVAPAEFPGFLQGLAAGERGLVGGNVTIPHKETAFALAERPDDIARELGAANTLWREEGRLHATNTDGHGFVANLDERAPGWDRATSAVVLGAGGASRAVIQAIRDRGIRDIRVVNRTVARARELADRFGAAVSAHPVAALPELLHGAGFFVNTTSLGMDGDAAPVLDFRDMAPDAVVTDIVYVPLMTPFLQQAQSQGLRTADGLGMLLHQAAPGFERWFGRRPVIDETLRALIVDDMTRHA